MLLATLMPEICFLMGFNKTGQTLHSMKVHATAPTKMVSSTKVQSLSGLNDETLLIRDEKRYEDDLNESWFDIYILGSGSTII